MRREAGVTPDARRFFEHDNPRRSCLIVVAAQGESGA
jgi:hypothetical protein